MWWWRYERYVTPEYHRFTPRFPCRVARFSYLCGEQQFYPVYLNEFSKGITRRMHRTSCAMQKADWQYILWCPGNRLARSKATKPCIWVRTSRGTTNYSSGFGRRVWQCAKAQKAYYKFDGYEEGNPSDGNLLPDGRWMTTQCFWLNNTYVKSILRDDLK